VNVRPLAVVTGGSRGIGRAVALAFAREGYAVSVCGREKAALEETRRELAEVTPDALVVAADVGSAPGARRFAEQTLERFPHLDVLVNNAGLLGPLKRVQDYPAPDWEEVVRVNVSGLFHVTKAFLPAFLSRRAGCIMNVSSGVGLKGRALWGAYSVSKFALEGFTQVLAEELHSMNVCVYSINPGPTRTAMRAAVYPKEDPATLPPPEQTASAFVELARRRDVNASGRHFDARALLVAATRPTGT
jgi:NAD(P)-dependent dehydrogenase (short-subunit alcohol dehydrogenase family)